MQKKLPQQPSETEAMRRIRNANGTSPEGEESAIGRSIVCYVPLERNQLENIMGAGGRGGCRDRNRRTNVSFTHAPFQAAWSSDTVVEIDGNEPGRRSDGYRTTESLRSGHASVAEICFFFPISHGNVNCDLHWSDVKGGRPCTEALSRQMRDLTSQDFSANSLVHKFFFHFMGILVSSACIMCRLKNIRPSSH